MKLIGTFWASADVDEYGFREDSRQLEEFRVRDFSTMPSELAKLIKRSKAPTRYVALVDRVAKELAQQYIRPPTRKWGTRGMEMSDALAERYDDLYEDSNVDWHLQRSQERLSIHQSIIIVAHPDGPGRVRLENYAPYESDVQFENPLEHDIRRASDLRLLVPLKHINQSTFYGERVYTPTEAWTEKDGKRIGVFTGSETDLTNPLGYIPAVGIRTADPTDGMWYPPIMEDLRQLEIAVNAALADIELIARYECYGREALTGDGAPAALRQMQDGPDFMRVFPSDTQYSYTVTNPPIAAYVSAIETQVRFFAAANSISPSSLISSRLNQVGITGDAKAVERQDMEEARERRETTMRMAEKQLAGVMVDVQNLQALEPLPPVRVKVNYHYTQPKRNDLQVSQAREIDFSQGVDSATEYVSRTEGVSIDDAKAIADMRQEEYISRKLRLVAAGVSESTQGLDRVDSAT